ncbi:DUF4276 family protein [Merismopedia glauca]|uniref:DUF4276 domain-containing protein n=1 Tax=Merismopedia glauca CCAP 1448/3 TaxID=1296344 RepID=A0A2T1C2A5_9CYAN|nr:DUF4276 family protein [Merismopedia glauca]PSB02399.1 hypothetical protein C7B64_13215 [Merismopedia glauca CCAP 1448/3]
MHIEFLIEDYSGEEALNKFLPRCLTLEIEYQVRRFNGKQDLLKKLPDRLKGYKAWIPEDWLIVILVDRDNEDCHQLKQKLENIAITAGFITKSNNSCSFQVLNRIMVEELEAWFFGDIPAIIQAYPGVKPSLAQQEKYRDPDAIQGGTWEALERVLQKARYHQGGLDKPKAAREIAEYMTPETNRSKSFQVFYDGLRTWQNRSLD